MVKDALLTIGCYPVEQANFAPDYRTVRKMLEAKIGECQALIHVVGLRYGAEPDPARLAAGQPRRSYTQLEYDIGRELAEQRGDKRFRVYTFVCPETFPYDTAPDPEPEDKRALQLAHRREILDRELTYETPKDVEEVRTNVLSLEEETLQLRAEYDRLRRTSLTVSVAVLVFLVVGVATVWRLTRKTGQIQLQQARVNGMLTEQHEEIVDIRELLRQIVDRSIGPDAAAASLTPKERFDRALGEVAAEKGVGADALQSDVDAFITKVGSDAAADDLDHALAAFASQDFAAAAEAGDRAAAEARRRYQADIDAPAEREKERTALQLTADARAAERLRGLTTRHDAVLTAKETALVADLDTSVARDVGVVVRSGDLYAWLCDRELRGNHILWTIMRRLGEPTLRDDYRAVPNAEREEVVALETAFVENTLAEIGAAKAKNDTLRHENHTLVCTEVWDQARTPDRWSRAITIELPVTDHIRVHPTELEVRLAEFLVYGEWELTRDDWSEPNDVQIHLAPPLAAIDPAWGKKALDLLVDAEQWISPEDSGDNKWRRLLVTSARASILVQLGDKQGGVQVLQDFLQRHPTSRDYKPLAREVERLLGVNAEAAATGKAIAACQDVDRDKIAEEVDRVWDVDGARGALQLRTSVRAHCAKLAPAVDEALTFVAALHGDCAALKAAGTPTGIAICE